MRDFLKPIYLKALIIYLVYGFFGKLLFFKGVVSSATTVAYITLFVYYIAFSIIFLYIFSHEDFFKFAKVIEKKETKKEKKLLRKYIHLGKIAAIFIIGVLVGPVFAALTTRILLHRSPYRYLIIVIVSVLSTAIWLASFKGILGQFSFIQKLNGLEFSKFP